MRVASRLAADILLYAGPFVQPGITTDRLDQIVHEKTIELGGYPSPLGYRGFPKSVCTSINEVICHGIPDSRPLVEGDIVNVDVTIYIHGVHGDTSMTFIVGETDEYSQDVGARDQGVARPCDSCREARAADQRDRPGHRNACSKA